MVREIKMKKQQGLDELEKMEALTDNDMAELEKIRKEDFREQELDSGFYFSVVFNTRKERDEWLQSRNLKLVEDNFIKISDFNI